jgi:Domain of Unknown Function (DUF326)
MNQVAELLAAHPQATTNETLVRCVEECFACVVACTSCADANLAEEDVEDLRHCIQLCLDCADVCAATGQVLTRQTSPEPRLTRSLLEACLLACRLCAEECERHAAHHEHCRICAETCRRCEQACAGLLASVGA